MVLVSTTNPSGPVWIDIDGLLDIAIDTLDYPVHEVYVASNGSNLTGQGTAASPVWTLAGAINKVAHKLPWTMQQVVFNMRSGDTFDFGNETRKEFDILPRYTIQTADFGGGAGGNARIRIVSADAMFRSNSNITYFKDVDFILTGSFSLLLCGGMFEFDSCRFYRCGAANWVAANNASANFIGCEFLEATGTMCVVTRSDRKKAMEDRLPEPLQLASADGPQAPFDYSSVAHRPQRGSVEEEYGRKRWKHAMREEGLGEDLVVTVQLPAWYTR